MTNSQLVLKVVNTAQNSNTAYVWGAFGSPITSESIARAVSQYPSYNTKRQATLTALIGKNYFMFDCIGLIKGLLWGWTGDSGAVYGGAVYASNGVPDLDADTMLVKCSGITTDFSSILPGEVVWMSNHIGIYIGSGKVVEATPSWSDGVQITACLNIGAITGLNGRTWTKHGKLPYITYEAVSDGASSGSSSATDTSNTPSSWAEAAWQWAVTAGITDGTNHKGALTREQGITMMYRMFKMINS